MSNFITKKHKSLNSPYTDEAVYVKRDWWIAPVGTKASSAYT